MRKMFSRSKSSNSKPSFQNQVIDDHKSKKDIIGSSKNEQVARDAMNHAKRQLHKFDLPTSDQGFKDLLKSYEEGKRFQYVALVGSKGESYESRVRKVVTFNFRRSKIVDPEMELPLIKLVEDCKQFNLSEVVNMKKGKPYIRLASLIGIYTPLISSFSDFSRVCVDLTDIRKLTDQSVQVVRFNSNVPEKFELSLDYCIPRESADKIILNIALEQAFLVRGEQWGTLQMMLIMEQSDAPYNENLREVIAVVGMPRSLLENYTTNPNVVDTTVTETQRKVVRDMYESGDICDETEPIKDDLEEIIYAKSSMGVKVKGPKTKKTFAEGWDHLNNSRVPLQDAYVNSADPESDDEIKVNTAELKKKLKEKLKAKISDISDEEVDVEVLKSNEERPMKGIKFNEFET
uniref:Putative movement protein n=4 Tax=Watermelon crinkle leaf-associated virus 2 TaxID=2034157 RepID=A0A8D6BL82_9VIRU|nr:putative movement protein [Watermelon crinkle leaf-associated virus 2]